MRSIWEFCVMKLTTGPYFIQINAVAATTIFDNQNYQKIKCEVLYTIELLEGSI